MLRTWLGPTSFDAFREDHLGKQPLARPACDPKPGALLDWDVLDALLRADVPPDIIVVARGQSLAMPVPRSVEQARMYLGMGIGFCLRHTERSLPDLARVAGAFETDLGEAQVQVFVTPGDTHGFGWHYDDEDVFILHTHGVKDYYFRANTVASELRAHGREFQRYRQETSPQYCATLIAGDFLYLPARWWHMALCRETSLSISVGVRPRTST